jgi:hypothetical protein
LALFPTSTAAYRQGEAVDALTWDGEKNRRSPDDIIRLLPWSGMGIPAPHGRQRWTSLFSDPAFAPALLKKPDPSLL